MKNKVNPKTRQKIRRFIKKQPVIKRLTIGVLYDPFTHCVFLPDRRIGAEKLASHSDLIRDVYSDRAHLYDRLMGRSIRRCA